MSLLASLLLCLPIDVASQADQYLTNLATCGFRGVAFISKDGEALLMKAYGLADVERGTPMTTQCVMTTGSLTKQFTGTAIALAMERGLLDLDDSIVEFFDDVPVDRRGIQIRHLLTHTAGLPGAVGHDWDLEGTRERVFELAMSCELLGPPGGPRSYSNVGYALLAMILEEVTGIPYEEFLLDELFLPAGMEHTGNALADHDGMLFPTGYRGGEVAPTFVDQPMLDDGPTWHLRGNGGVLSTVEDLHRWCRILDGHEELLSEEVRALLDAPLVGSESDGYGFGWGHALSGRGTHMVEHDGGNGVFNADIHRYVDEGVTLCVMTSVAECIAEEVIEALECIAFGHEIAMPPVCVDVRHEDLEVLAGTYVLEDGTRIQVTPTQSGVALSAEGATARALVAGLDGSPEPQRAAVEETCLTATRNWVMQGDYQALAEASGGRLSETRLREAFGRDRSRMERRYGRLISVHVLPPVAGDPDAVWMEVRHERGSWYPRHGVKDGQITGTGVDSRRPPGIPGSEFLPEGGGRFRSFAMTAPRAVVIELDGTTLQFPEPGIVASKIPD